MKSRTLARTDLKPTAFVILLAALALLLAACAGAAQAPQATSTNPAAVASPPAVSSGEATINVANDPELGQILVDGKGMTLYIFTKDEPDKSNCNAECLASWPPLLTEGNPTLGAGVDSTLVGSVPLADGSLIVTYNHMPLYYWVKDTKAGDTTGQGVGGVWFVVSPDGKAVGAPESAGADAAPQAAAAEATINVASDPKLGQILVDGKGMTLYIFKNDERDKSNCDADCLAKWPPLLTQGSPELGPGVDASKVGTTELADGSMIVTYDHRPLYYWIKDAKAGDTTGQGVGGVWFVISPSGEEIDDPDDALSYGAANTGTTFTEPTINVYNDPTLGPILVDGKGMTLYMYTRDTADKVNCAGDCLVNWPPLVTKGSPVLGSGVDDSLIGTATLPDGSLIVTYNHMPLYYWIKDAQAGDTTGQGVGGVWYVVSPEGEVIGR